MLHNLACYLNWTYNSAKADMQFTSAKTAELTFRVNLNFRNWIFQKRSLEPKKCVFSCHLLPSFNEAFFVPYSWLWLSLRKWHHIENEGEFNSNNYIWFLLCIRKNIWIMKKHTYSNRMGIMRNIKLMLWMAPYLSMYTYHTISRPT